VSDTAKAMDDYDLLKLAPKQTTQLMENHTEDEIKAYLDGRSRLEVVRVPQAGKHRPK
jgi:hypothetical protein